MMKIVITFELTKIYVIRKTTILENNINDTIFNYANKHNHYFYRGQGLVLHEANWTTEVESRLRKFEKRIIFALKNEGWDGKESNDTVTWTFAGGLFYSITVITTIGTIKQILKTVKLPFEMIFFFSGYGHIAPKTPWAKIVTIFYAILGIPLTVLCWSNIGDAMANAFRFCYWRICCYVCTKKPKKKKKRHMSRGGGGGRA